MNEKLKKRNPYPLKIEGQGSWSVEDTFLAFSEIKIWKSENAFCLTWYLNKNNEKPQKSTKNTNQSNKNSVELCWHRIANDV